LPDAVERKETGSDRSGAGATDPPSRAAPSLAILGADALLAAQPATAVQLAHACVRIGFQAVVPSSWGDELVAGGCLKQIASRRGGGDMGPTIFCACPYVAHRLLAVGPDLEPFLASFVSPPVAVARYLRALYAPHRIRLTYIGRCPGGADDSIDARLTPDELLAVLTERGVTLLDQPRAFDSVIPPDRRRFLSQPGGLPAADVLRRVDPDRRVVELTTPELVTELAQQLLSKNQVLLDVATRLGCACSGAVADVPPDAARPRVTAIEPPRASSPIVDDRVPVAIELPLPSVARDPVDVVPAVASRRSSGATRILPPSPPPEPPPTAQDVQGGSGGRRRSPTHGLTVRQPSGGIPTTRSGEGRALPRAYVARRGQRSGGGQRSTPPRGEPRQFDAGSSSSRGGSGSTLRGGGGASRSEGERPAQATPVATSPAAPAAVAPSAEMPAKAPERTVVARAVGGVPDRAADPHEEPIITEMPLPEPPPQVQMENGSGARSTPVSELGTVPTTSFRMRTVKLARVAVSAAHQRRAILGTLLGVALISATVGVLAGRWLAGRSEAPAATR
jgi:hypothetical protein